MFPHVHFVCTHGESGIQTSTLVIDVLLLFVLIVQFNTDVRLITVQSSEFSSQQLDHSRNMKILLLLSLAVMVTAKPRRGWGSIFSGTTKVVTNVGRGSSGYDTWQHGNHYDDPNPFCLDSSWYLAIIIQVRSLHCLHYIHHK